jgi:hypothetical protein
MDNPREYTLNLQNIQWEIARIVDQYWATPDYDREIVRWLKEGFSELNDAKIAISFAVHGNPFEEATTMGTKEIVYPSELPKE